MYTDTNNKYISSLYDLVEAVYYKDYEGFSTRDIRKRIKKEYDKCKDIILNIRDLKNPLKFDDIWEFAEFIMMAEKVYFYQNVQGSGICCDKCNELDRILFFAYDEKNVFIKLIMHRSTVGDQLTIMVYREWGRKDGTKFEVSNQECNITSDSDHMLVNTINAYVQNSIADLYETYIELAYHSMIYDTVVGETKYKTSGDK